MPSIDTLRKDLSGLMVEYAMEEARKYGFIGMEVAPFFVVDEHAGSIAVMTREFITRMENTARGENGGYNTIASDYDTMSYQTEENGLQNRLDRRKQARYRSFFDMEKGETKVLIHKILMGHEYRAASLVQNTGIYTAHAAGTAWDDPDADIIGDIEAGLTELETKTGLPRTMITLVCDGTVFHYMNFNTALRAQWTATYNLNGGVAPVHLNPAQIAQVFEIKAIKVARGKYNAAGRKVTANMQPFFSSAYVQLAYLAEPYESDLTPSAWRTVLWQADCPTFPAVDRWYSEDIRSDMVRVRTESDEMASAEADLCNYMIATGIGA